MRKVKNHSLPYFLLILLLLFSVEGFGQTKQERIEEAERKLAQCTQEINSLEAELKSFRKEVYALNKSEATRILVGEDIAEDGKSYQAMLAEALEVAAGNGMNVDSLNRLQRILKDVILRADFPDPNESGGLLDYFYSAETKEEEIAKAQEVRVQYYKTVSKAFIHVLLEPDAPTALKKFQDYKNSIILLQEIETDRAIIASEFLEQDLKLVTELASGVPALGDAMDIWAVATGEELSGEEMSKTSRAITLLLIVTPDALAYGIKNSPTAQKNLSRFAGMIGNAADETLTWMCKQVADATETAGAAKELTAAKLRAVKEKIVAAGVKADPDAKINTPSTAKTATKTSLKSLDDETRKAFEAAGEMDPKWTRRLATAQDILDRGRDAMVGTDMTKRYQAFLEIRRNKEALHMIQANKDGIQTLYRDLEMDFLKMVDKEAIKELTYQKSKKLVEIAEENGLDVGSVKIQPLSATSSQGVSALYEMGMDRDITYCIVYTNKKGEKVIDQIPTDEAKEIYDRMLYEVSEEVTGNDFPLQLDAEVYDAYAKKLDHSYVAAGDKEAFDMPDGVPIGNFLNYKAHRSGDLPVPDTRDVRDEIAATMEHKAIDDWFEREFDDLGEKLSNTREGFRQTVKMFDRFVYTHAKVYGATNLIDAELISAMKIMASCAGPKFMDDLAYLGMKANELPVLSPDQAERALKSIGFSKEDVVKKMAKVYKEIEKSDAAKEYFKNQ